jgi:cytochrome P450
VALPDYAVALTNKKGGMKMNTVANLFSLEMVNNPYPTYAELRANDPVCRIEPYGWWVVSRYEDVQYVLKHPSLFSSTGLSEMRNSLEEERLQREPLVNEQTVIVASDPPVHTRLRKLINGAFTPKAVARLEGRIRSITSEYIDRILEKDEFDLIADLAVPLPVIVIAEMLGVDPARRADFKRWSDDAFNEQPNLGRRSDAEIDRLLQSRREFIAFFREMIEERKKCPREDLISDLCRAEVESEMLTAEEVLEMCIILMIAGNETTTNLIGNATLALLEHPEVLCQLRHDPALIQNFIEEVLRYDGPAKMVNRRATEDVVLAGVTIPKDALVIAVLASANRDPAAFRDPDRFDITRDHRGHLAFGYGIHFCVGATLSRLETRVAVEEMLRRLPAFSRRSGRLEWSPAFGLRGLKTLPLRFERAAAA